MNNNNNKKERKDKVLIVLSDDDSEDDDCSIIGENQIVGKSTKIKLEEMKFEPEFVKKWDDKTFICNCRNIIWMGKFNCGRMTCLKCGKEFCAFCGYQGSQGYHFRCRNCKK